MEEIKEEIKKEVKREEMLFTANEAAEILKCNVAFVHRLRKAGLLRFMKLGKYKVRKAELERFLEEMEGFDVTDPEHIVPLEETAS